MSRETTIGVANVKIVHDKGRNLEHFADVIADAADKGVEFLVLPELALHGYVDFAFPQDTPSMAEQKEYYFREAEPIGGPSTQRIADLARRFDMVVQFGLAERALSGNVIYNSVAAVGPSGLLATYRKLHNQFEYPYFMPGNAPAVVDLPFARAGLLICYDICFPELARVYALEGAEVASISTAWPMRDHDPAGDYYGWAMDTFVQANALFNQMWVIISNHCETGAYSTNTSYYGRSQIVDPAARVVAVAPDGEECVVTHTADLRGEVLRARTAGLFGKNFLQDRRPEHYGLVSTGACYHLSSEPLGAEPSDVPAADHTTATTG
jgi:predicted amidohydrolase